MGQFPIEQGILHWQDSLYSDAYDILQGKTLQKVKKRKYDHQFLPQFEDVLQNSFEVASHGFL
jgi:hypothetical protein